MAEVIEVTTNPVTITVTSPGAVTVDVQDSTAQVIISAERGPQGIPGPSGAATTLTRIAGESIGGHRVVRTQSGAAYYATQSDPDQTAAAIGLTANAADAGGELSIVTSGEITESSWNWTPGSPLYLTGQGQLTHTPPPSGPVRQIAVADSATTIIVSIQPEIRR